MITVKEVPEKMMEAMREMQKPMELKAETPEWNEADGMIESLIFYIYPLMKTSAIAEAREEIRERIYKSGLTDWDLMKVFKAIDGVEEEK